MGQGGRELGLTSGHFSSLEPRVLFFSQTQFPIPLPSWAVSLSAPTLGTMFADLDYDIEEDKL